MLLPTLHLSQWMCWPHRKRSLDHLQCQEHVVRAILETVSYSRVRFFKKIYWNYSGSTESTSCPINFMPVLCEKASPTLAKQSFKIKLAAILWPDMHTYTNWLWREEVLTNGLQTVATENRCFNNLNPLNLISNSLFSGFYVYLTVGPRMGEWKLQNRTFFFSKRGK